MSLQECALLLCKEPFLKCNGTDKRFTLKSTVPSLMEDHAKTPLQTLSESDDLRILLEK